MEKELEGYAVEVTREGITFVVTNSYNEEIPDEPTHNTYHAGQTYYTYKADAASDWPALVAGSSVDCRRTALCRDRPGAPQRCC